jgi:hypothetical protein
MAEWVCGKSSSERRAVFVQYALAALRSALLSDQAAAATLSNAKDDARVKVLSQSKWMTRDDEHPLNK